MCVAEDETKLGLIQVMCADEGNARTVGEGLWVRLVADSLGARKNIVIPTLYSSTTEVVIAAITAAVNFLIGVCAVTATVGTTAAAGRGLIVPETLLP